MNAYIITGGDILLKNISVKTEEGDIVIAADSGYKTALDLKLPVDILIGDMDSLKCDIPKGIEVIKLPEEKDLTDTEAALALALEKGADNITIIGGIGSRLDHTLASVGLLGIITLSLRINLMRL